VTPLLELSSVRVAYGHVTAVRDVSLAVPAGSMVALLGPNGAGKTSLLHAATGLVAPSGGTVTFAGAAVTGMGAHRLARRGVRLVPEGRALFGPMTVRENLLVGGHDVPPRALPARLDQVFALFPVLRDRAGQKAATLSGGEQQMLSIARALVAAPRLLVLDEPSMGLAPLIVADIVAALGRLRDEGLTVLLSEQNARSVLAVADAAAVMSHGRLAALGPPAEVAAGLEDAYLGKAGKAAERPAGGGPAARP
jgi:branched-chain amino acid transport system ATP-binding protein